MFDLPQQLQELFSKIEEQDAKTPFWIVGPETGRMLYWLIRVANPERVLEIGTSVGYSGLWMAAALEANGGGTLWTIESNVKRQKLAEAHFEQSGLGHRIELLKGHAPSIFDLEGVVPDSVDLAFFDATKYQHTEFFTAVYPRMKSGGMIIVDNVQSHRFGEMEKFINETLAHTGLKVVEIPVGAGLLIARVL
jgi:predicted O-methyltransferase YrrM